MSNNEQIEILRNKINDLETELKYTEDLREKLRLYNELLVSRRQYTPLLLKKRPFLLTMGIVFAIFYGISLAICLPPYIIRGKKRDINEARIKEIEHEIRIIRRKISEFENPEDTLKSY